MVKKTRSQLCLFAGLVLGLFQRALSAQDSYKLSQLPEPLKGVWQRSVPEMTSASRCAAAFDNYSDFDRMTLKCSIYIKLGAEGARRAMRYCEEEREKKHIHAPCKIVLEE